VTKGVDGARRLGVITDAHGNLPATQAILDRLAEARCAQIFHLGDAIGMGPHPSEVVSLLADRGVVCLMGNHDELLVRGLPEPVLGWMSEGEAAHHRWVHAQLTDAQRRRVGRWPYEATTRVGRTTVTLVHYARTARAEFHPVADAGASHFAELFGELPGELILFGHDHRSHDITSAGRRFVDPGSVGCHDRSIARGVILEAHPNGARVSKLAVPYDDRQLLAAFEHRRVPDRALILRTFMRRVRPSPGPAAA
jgi:predicted phosphodiesterase